MEEDEFTQFYNLVEENYVSETPDKSEAATKILKYKSRIEYLLFLQQYLEQYAKSDQHLLTTFNFMRELVKLRGCLLSPDELIEHYNFIKQFIFNNHESLLSRPIIIKSSTQDLAYTIRITFEQDNSKGDTLINDVGQIFSSEDSRLQYIALFEMTSLVDCFKEPLSNNSFTENNENKKKFERTYLSFFTTAIYGLIFEGTDEILVAALELLLHCFEFFESPNKTTISVNSYNGCFAEYFSKTDFLRRILELCTDQNTSDLSYKILIYMASASNVWESPAMKAGYFISFSELLVSIIDLQDESSGNIGDICIILNLLGKNLNEDQFIENGNAEQFFNSVLRFSNLVFTKADPSSLHNIFIFWSKISDWSLNKEEFINIMFQLIADFINSTLNSIAENGEEWATNFRTEYINSGFEPIWKIAHSCYIQVCDLIIERISAVIESQTNLLQIAFMVMIISSRFGNISIQDVEDKAQEMYKVVIDLIDSTTPSVNQIFSNDSTSDIFENSIVIFMNYYQKSYFSGSKHYITTTDEAQKEEIERALAEEQEKIKAIIEVFSKRILIEFNSFVFIANCPILVEKIFDLVDYLVKKEECRKLIEKSLLEVGLFTQSLEISFEGVPPQDVKRPRIKLYYLYTSLISTIGGLQEFLAKFDARFQDIASSGYADQDGIFALFCDLRGVFKYLLRNVNQSSGGDIKKKYIRVCNWFSSEHVQDSIEIIKNNSANPFIVNIVCNAWICLFPDRFEQQKIKGRNQQPTMIIDNFDGFGIILFKTMLLIAGTVFQSCPNDIPYFSILFKVIRYCLTTKYTNFGVMSYYEDDSFNEMSTLLFKMVESAEFDCFVGYKTVLNNILLAMSAITESEKCLDSLFESEDKSNLQLIFSFTEKCMFLDSHNREVQNNDVFNKNLRDPGIKEKKNIMNRDLWESSWKVLQPILNKSFSAPESIKLFQPHSILILNSAMMKYDEKEMMLGPILLASFIHDGQFVKSLIDLVICIYDERFQKYISDRFVALFDVAQPDFDDFIKRLKEFSSGFRKYQNDFIDNPNVVQFL